MIRWIKVEYETNPKTTLETSLEPLHDATKIEEEQGTTKDSDQHSGNEVRGDIPIEEGVHIHSLQWVDTRVWDKGELDNDAECLSSFNEIVEENHEAMIFDDDLQEVYKDDNTWVVSGVNLNPLDDLFYGEDDAYTHSCAFNLENQLKISCDNIVAPTKHYDDTHELMAEYYWRNAVKPGILGGETLLIDLQTLKKALAKMKTNYLRLLSNRNHILMLVEMYHGVLEGEDEEIDKITYELETTQEFLKSNQLALKESKLKVEELCMGLICGPSSFPIVDNQDERGTHDGIEEPPVIFENEEHPVVVQALAGMYVPEGFEYASMGHIDRCMWDEGTSIWDRSLVDMSGVDTERPVLVWDLGGVFHHMSEA